MSSSRSGFSSYPRSSEIRNRAFPESLHAAHENSRAKKAQMAKEKAENQEANEAIEALNALHGEKIASPIRLKSLKRSPPRENSEARRNRIAIELFEEEKAKKNLDLLLALPDHELKKRALDAGKGIPVQPLRELKKNPVQLYIPKRAPQRIPQYAPQQAPYRMLPDVPYHIPQEMQFHAPQQAPQPFVPMYKRPSVSPIKRIAPAVSNKIPAINLIKKISSAKKSKTKLKIDKQQLLFVLNKIKDGKTLNNEDKDYLIYLRNLTGIEVKPLKKNMKTFSFAFIENFILTHKITLISLSFILFVFMMSRAKKN